MNTPKIVNSQSRNILHFFLKYWNNLDDSQKSILIKIWNVITYKWQLQILLNLPFLIWWALDKSIVKVHDFDLRLIGYLHLPEWALNLMGFGHSPV